MEKMYNVTVTETELRALLTIVRRSCGNTRDKQRRRMLGILCDELDATLHMEMLKFGAKHLEELKAKFESKKKEEKRKHLRVIV